MSRRMVSQVEEGRTIMVVNSKGGDGDERIQVLNGVYQVHKGWLGLRYPPFVG